MKSIEHDKKGSVSGLISLSRNLGLLTGASLMGFIFSKASNNSGFDVNNPISTEYGMHVTFIAAIVILGFGVFISYIIRRVKSLKY